MFVSYQELSQAHMYVAIYCMLACFISIIYVATDLFKYCSQACATDIIEARGGV